MVDFAELTKHPEKLDRDTLYELRSTLALYPYFQTARLLMLQNLYLLHDATFDEELRRAAIYITDRKVLFRMIEAGHYQLKTRTNTGEDTESATPANTKADADSRTLSLIDNFLDSIPKESEEEERPKRKPTPADAAVDYVAYLLESGQADADEDIPQLKGQQLIDDFIENDHGRIKLNDNPEFVPQLDDNSQEEQNDGEETYFTETLARIYIKQGNYLKALEIIKQLNLAYPKKNAYFADQIRFLQKLIIINNKK